MKPKLLFAVCECGDKILIVPDLNEMSNSILAHAAKHAKKEITLKKAKAERHRIEELLTRKVLKSVNADQTKLVFEDIVQHSHEKVCL